MTVLASIPAAKRGACASAGGHARSTRTKPPLKDRDGFMSLPSHGTSVYFI